MKILLCLVCINISVSLWSKTSESEIQKPFSDNGEDYVIIYQYSVGPDPLANSDYDRSKQYLNKTLTIFDNAELKGTPILTISPQEVKHEGVQYTFKDSFIGKCKPECDKYKFIPIDFLRIYFDKISIAVKDYKEGIARVEHKNKSYYFKLSLDDTQEYSWRKHRTREKIKKYLDQDQSYKIFLTNFKKCIARKDLKCFEKLLDKEKPSIEDIETEAKKRAIYDDKVSCEKFENVKSQLQLSMDEVPEDLLKGIKDIDFIWSKIDRLLNEENKGAASYLEIKDFGETALYEMQLKLAHETCGNWLDISITLYKNDNKWKIVSLNLSAFKY